MAGKKSVNKEKRRADYLLRRIRKVVCDPNWKFRLSLVGDDSRLVVKHDITTRAIGACSYEYSQILIHHRYEVISTLVHECLHAIYEDNSEKQTLELEKFVMSQMSPRQAKNLLVLFVTRLVTV